MRAKLYNTRVIKCHSKIYEKAPKPTESSERKANKNKTKADFCLYECPHKDQPCDGSCKEFRAWQKLQIKLKEKKNV